MRVHRHPLGVRLRWWWHRHPVAGWVLSVVCIAIVVQLPDAVADDANRPTRGVSVAAATTDLPIGHRVGPTDVVHRSVAHIDGTPVDDPVGRVVTALVLAGEPLVTERLAPSGADGTPALVPPGEVGVAVPIALAAPPLSTGDRVDLFVTELEGSVTRQVVHGALVVDVADDALSVSVPADAARAIAAGVAVGSITVALLGPAG